MKILKEIKIGGVEGINKIPEGSIMHPIVSDNRILDYSKYNPVWEDPDNPGFMINNFKLNEFFNNDFLSDKIWIDKDPILSKRLDIILNDLRTGNFVFDDNDSRIIKRYYDKSDPIHYNWDTCTHYLQDFVHRHKNKSLVYTKDLDNKNRISYRVDAPKKINGVWVCNIEVSNCVGHKYMNYDYGRKQKRFSDVIHNLREQNIINAFHNTSQP